MNTRREDMASVVLDGFIYAIGGYNREYLPTVERYNIANDRWSRVILFHYFQHF